MGFRTIVQILKSCMQFIFEVENLDGATTPILASVSDRRFADRIMDAQRVKDQVTICLCNENVVVPGNQIHIVH